MFPSNYHPEILALLAHHSLWLLMLYWVLLVFLTLVLFYMCMFFFIFLLHKGPVMLREFFDMIFIIWKLLIYILLLMVTVNFLTDNYSRDKFLQGLNNQQKFHIWLEFLYLLSFRHYIFYYLSWLRFKLFFDFFQPIALLLERIISNTLLMVDWWLLLPSAVLSKRLTGLLTLILCRWFHWKFFPWMVNLWLSLRSFLLCSASELVITFNFCVQHGNLSYFLAHWQPLPNNLVKIEFNEYVDFKEIYDSLEKKFNGWSYFLWTSVSESSSYLLRNIHGPLKNIFIFLMEEFISFSLCYFFKHNKLNFSYLSLANVLAAPNLFFSRHNSFFAVKFMVSFFWLFQKFLSIILTCYMLFIYLCLLLPILCLTLFRALLHLLPRLFLKLLVSIIDIILLQVHYIKFIILILALFLILPEYEFFQQFYFFHNLGLESFDAFLYAQQTMSVRWSVFNCTYQTPVDYMFVLFQRHPALTTIFLSIDKGAYIFSLLQIVSAYLWLFLENIKIYGWLLLRLIISLIRNPLWPYVYYQEELEEGDILWYFLNNISWPFYRYFQVSVNFMCWHMSLVYICILWSLKISLLSFNYIIYLLFQFKPTLYLIQIICWLLSPWSSTIIHGLVEMFQMTNLFIFQCKLFILQSKVYVQDFLLPHVFFLAYNVLFHIKWWMIPLHLIFSWFTCCIYILFLHYDILISPVFFDMQIKWYKLLAFYFPDYLPLYVDALFLKYMSWDHLYQLIAISLEKFWVIKVRPYADACSYWAYLDGNGMFLWNFLFSQTMIILHSYLFKAKVEPGETSSYSSIKNVGILKNEWFNNWINLPLELAHIYHLSQCSRQNFWLSYMSGESFRGPYQWSLPKYNFLLQGKTMSYRALFTQIRPLEYRLNIFDPLQPNNFLEFENILRVKSESRIFWHKYYKKLLFGASFDESTRDDLNVFKEFSQWSFLNVQKLNLDFFRSLYTVRQKLSFRPTELFHYSLVWGEEEYEDTLEQLMNDPMLWLTLEKYISSTFLDFLEFPHLYFSHYYWLYWENPATEFFHNQNISTSRGINLWQKEIYLPHDPPTHKFYLQFLNNLFVVHLYIIYNLYFQHFFLMNDDIPYIVMLPNFNKLALWLQPLYDFSKPYILVNYVVHGQFHDLGCFYEELDEDDFFEEWEYDAVHDLYFSPTTFNLFTLEHMSQNFLLYKNFNMFQWYLEFFTYITKQLENFLPYFYVYLALSYLKVSIFSCSFLDGYNHKFSLLRIYLDIKKKVTSKFFN